MTATDDSWSQCVDCDQPDFQNTCVVWSTPLRASAVHVCDENCLNTMCTVDDSGMECVDGYTCVVQADGGWSQCIGKRECDLSVCVQCTAESAKHGIQTSHLIYPEIFVLNIQLACLIFFFFFPFFFFVSPLLPPNRLQQPTAIPNGLLLVD